MEKEKIVFTTKDILCESGLYLLSTHDFVDSWRIAASAVRYNQAKQSGDPETVARAFRELHFEMKLFKKNFLNRGKGHW